MTAEGVDLEKVEKLEELPRREKIGGDRAENRRARRAKGMKEGKEKQTQGSETSAVKGSKLETNPKNEDTPSPDVFLLDNLRRTGELKNPDGDILTGKQVAEYVESSFKYFKTPEFLNESEEERQKAVEDFRKATPQNPQLQLDLARALRFLKLLPDRKKPVEISKPLINQDPLKRDVSARWGDAELDKLLDIALKEPQIVKGIVEGLNTQSPKANISRKPAELSERQGVRVRDMLERLPDAVKKFYDYNDSKKSYRRVSEGAKSIVSKLKVENDFEEMLRAFREEKLSEQAPKVQEARVNDFIRRFPSDDELRSLVLLAIQSFGIALGEGRIANKENDKVGKTANDTPPKTKLPKSSVGEAYEGFPPYKTGVAGGYSDIVRTPLKTQVEVAMEYADSIAPKSPTPTSEVAPAEGGGSLPPKPEAPAPILEAIVSDTEKAKKPRSFISAGVVTAEEIARAKSPDFTIALALDRRGFAEFLSEYPDSDKRAEDGDIETIRERFLAFLLREKLAEEFLSGATEKLSKEAGLSLDKEAKDEIRSVVEDMAFERPIEIAEISSDFETMKKLPAEIAELERKLQSFANAPSAEEEAGKKERESLVKDRDAIVLTHLTLGQGRWWKFDPLQFSKEEREARKTTKRLLGTLDRLAMWDRVNSLEKSIEEVSKKIEMASEAKKVELGQLTKLKENQERVFRVLTSCLFEYSDVSRKIAEMARKKVSVKFNGLIRENMSLRELEDTEKYLDGFTAMAEKESGEAGSWDYRKAFDEEKIRKAIDTLMEKRVSDGINEIVGRSLGAGEGRFSKLKTSLKDFFVREKIGRKSGLEVKEFVLGVLRMKIEELKKIGSTEAKLKLTLLSATVYELQKE